MSSMTSTDPSDETKPMANQVAEEGEPSLPPARLCPKSSDRPMRRWKLRGFGVNSAPQRTEFFAGANQGPAEAGGVVAEDGAFSG
jgi:hypothetical protein